MRILGRVRGLASTYVDGYDVRYLYSTLVPALRTACVRTYAARHVAMGVVFGVCGSRPRQRHGAVELDTVVTLLVCN